MSILTNMLQGICAYIKKKKKIRKKKSLPTLPAKSQSDTPSTDIFPLGLIYFLLAGLVHFWSLPLGIAGVYSVSKISEISCFQPFPKQAFVFTCLQYKSFENTLGKEKWVVTSNFSFFRSVFYSFRELSAIQIEIVVYKLFQFGRV